LTLGGLAVGMALPVVAVRLMTALIYGFRPSYATVVAEASIVLLVVG
jgi:hypothetical protein